MSRSPVRIKIKNINSLSSLGYRIAFSSKDRQNALEKAVNKYGYLYVMRKVNAIYIFNKNNPKMSKKLVADKKWLMKNYKPKSSRKSRKTSRRKSSRKSRKTSRRKSRKSSRKSRKTSRRKSIKSSRKSRKTSRRKSRKSSRKSRKTSRRKRTHVGRPRKVGRPKKRVCGPGEEPGPTKKCKPRKHPGRHRKPGRPRSSRKSSRK